VARIHPTAIVHRDAKLGAGVTIGPYVIIEGAAVLGEGCSVQAHAVIGGNVTLGRENSVGYGAILGADPQDFAFMPTVKSHVQIGDGNRIREYCTIHRGTKEGSRTLIGSGCFLMAGAHLGHNVEIGNQVVIANNALLGGYVVVEDGVFIGGGCVFHQFVRVGRLAICQGASAFSKDIPPFVLAAERNTVAGLNVVGLRRSGLSSTQRAELKAAFDLLYRSGRNVSQALEAARERTWSAEAEAFFAFVQRSGRRGLCGWIRSAAVEAE
jgi:UDP-N-acetylglucosamine acyltransferase